MVIGVSQSWALHGQSQSWRPLLVSSPGHRRGVLVMALLCTMKWSAPKTAVAAFQPGWVSPSYRQSRRTFTSSSRTFALNEPIVTEAPLLLSEGLFSVNKPLNWTSNDVVSYIRRILERDARERGARPEKVGSRKNKSKIVRVGHGGTLDPLATGVLVIGVGKGTKQLQTYLEGPKGYGAGGELGFETTTLDMEGNVTKTASFEHATLEELTLATSKFIGNISQVPPIYSALRVNGKKLYEEARAGKTVDEIEIAAREVQVLSLEVVGFALPKFDIVVHSGGGFYVRSVIRDLGLSVGSVATTTYLERIQQGQFKLDDPGILVKDDWTPEKIYAAIDNFNAAREKSDADANQS